MVQRDKNSIRITQSAIDHSKGFLGAVIGSYRGAGAFVRDGLCCHKMPHRPRRFKLLVVVFKLLTICDTLAAISSFSSNFPAKPLPSCTPSSRCFSVALEDSMFLD